MSICLAAFLLLLSGRTAAAGGFTVQCPSAVERGRAFFVRVESDAPLRNLTVRWLDREFSPLAYETGRGFAAGMLLGVGLDAPAGHGVLHVFAETAAGRTARHSKVAVKERAFAEQRLEVEEEYVELPAKALERHRREKEEVRRVLDAADPGLFLECPLVRPVDGAVGSEYGLRRFFNGRPRAPHGGVDLRAAEGEPVRAMGAGRVALAADHYFSGRSVYLDHGQGVVSMYFHLSGVDVSPGQFVARGQVLGRAGATGRVTGPHLHFGLSVLGQKVDPLPLVDNGCAF
ncbi:MAG: M23 family metallopeptidase [Thermodesulfobacteriota bacterium]